MLLAAVLTLLTSETAGPSEADLFSAHEEQAIIDTWSREGVYRVAPLDPKKPYIVVQSAAGSTWLHGMYKRRDPGMPLRPDRDPQPRTPTHAAWDKWVRQRAASDKAIAQREAKRLNFAYSGFYGPPAPPMTAHHATTPSDLAAVAGDAPPLYSVVSGNQYTIVLDGFKTSYKDGVAVRPLYPFLRHEMGVAHAGSRITAGQVATLARKAGLTDSATRVMTAVSNLEGGFDSVNTYDTGRLSVGFLQFAALDDGSGSLGQLLLRTKKSAPAEFQTHFRQYGIDVTPTGQIVVLELKTLRERLGGNAVRAIAEDKRLTAVFQRAGLLSQTFRLQQLKTARDLYFPSDRTIQVNLNGALTPINVGQIVKSEAGLATLMDRLVNTGGLGNLEEAVNMVAKAVNARTVADLAQAEDWIVRRMTYRHDYLAVNTVSRPARMRGDLEGLLEVPVFDPQASGLIPDLSAQKPDSGQASTKPKTDDPKEAEPQRPPTLPGAPGDPRVSSPPRDPKKTTVPITDVGG